MLHYMFFPPPLLHRGGVSEPPLQKSDIVEIVLYQFPITQSDYQTAKAVAGALFSLTDVYRAAFKIGRSIWDITRPDLAGLPKTRASPPVLASLPYPWCVWPDDRAWSPSACARWCVHTGLPLIAVHMPPLPPPPRVPLAAPTSGVLLLLDRPDPRITYPHAYAETTKGANKLDTYAASHGFTIDWLRESPHIMTIVSAPLAPLPA
jgi:hypothetical protein